MGIAHFSCAAVPDKIVVGHQASYSRNVIRHSKAIMAAGQERSRPLLSLRRIVAAAAIGTATLLAIGATAWTEYDVTSALQA